MLFALDDIAERALPRQAVVGDGGGQAVPIMVSQAGQVALDNAGARRRGLPGKSQYGNAADSKKAKDQATRTKQD
ncbi:hypothetical protein C3469_22435 [Mycobacterium kansasii]|nr:hypothetical protein C3477_16070 [Mycobacterium kansasii]POY23347.1 hypothetical protein C3469_22435 [Mycobacterium kansasii]POY25009.1 hypothetical protein C3476_02740 [Mycobacterium kansasii]POY33363.1 hypothetical protein C3478_06810 [Mycobacterium kansasii]